MGSVNKNFERIKIPGPRRSAVDLSHEKKMSFQMGQLVPIYFEDVVPSDVFRVSSEVFVRLAPMLAPIMHRLDVFVHFFYVPYRILWANAELFFTGGEDGLSYAALPYVNYNNTNKTYFDKGTFWDYMGIPPTSATITQDVDLLAFPLAAYFHIYDEYYRNVYLQPEKSVSLSSGDNTNNLFSSYSGPCLARNLEPDYFISSTPTAQRGNPVELDLDVIGSGVGNIRMTDLANANPAAGDTYFSGTDKYLREAGAPGGELRFQSGYTITADAVLEMAELRRAMRLQEFLEMAHIAGGRYDEQMEVYFGQSIADHRANKPEYLGGGRQAVQISEVTSTAETLDSTDALSQPVGAMAGRGISMGKTNRFERQFQEHGCVMGIMSVMPRTAYYEGIDRYFRKTDRTEWLWPKFAQLGEQEVLQSEIFWDPTGTDMDDTFAYQSRYAEYKYKKSSVHGDFIDDFNYWHLARQLATAPALDNTFVVCENTDYDRIFAVTLGTVDKLYAQIYNDVQAIRPLPDISVPTF